MIHGKKIIAAHVQLAFLFLTTCGLTSEREQTILGYSTDHHAAKYADLLVEEERYTTAGLQYQKKYRRHLIGIAGHIIESDRLAIEKNSIGFYYDRKSGDPRRLYLGIDIDSGAQSNQPFERMAVALIRKDLADVIRTMHSCRSIFNEGDIAGMVIGWKWNAGSSREHVSVWIMKQDFIRYEDDLLTFDGLLQRSTVTNTTGRIIRLPL